ncbi:hypothetical protein ACFQDD_01940 [Halorubrum pallidum]|uniref:Uncharacterized protein n=1 Tax=Halorubrum pallidum TaxID=1526114 RepID=A0ABD5SYJ9_9EURY
MDLTPQPTIDLTDQCTVSETSDPWELPPEMVESLLPPAERLPELLPIHGAIPRVEHQQAHRDFLWAVRPPAAMISIKHARRILKRGETAATYFPPETDVITTTTQASSEYRRIQFSQEVALIRAFEPEFHLPWDWPLTNDMSTEHRAHYCRRVARGTVEMDRVLDGFYNADGNTNGLPSPLVAESIETTILPIIRGDTPAERAPCEFSVAEVNSPVAAKYGSHYMSRAKGGNYPALRESVEEIHEETNGQPLIVIGLLSPNDRYGLADLPSNVVGAAGLNQWISRVCPRHNSPEEMRDAYQTFEQEVADALDVPSSYDRPSIEQQISTS